MAGGWGCGACGGDNPDGTRFCGHCGTPRAASEAVTARPEERRLVTALFADISGFTTLADRLDPEELHAIISPAISRLAEVAERFGGTIAKYAGDALLVFFGAPVAQEDHAERALLVAAEMHRRLADLLPELPDEAQGLTLHIGVNTGHVVAGMFGGDIRSDYSILGDATNLAQRLESVAPSGETYVGQLTRDLTKDRFDLESVGELTLKGKPEPVPAWRLIGASSATSPAEVGVLGAGFVGRDAEVASVQRVIDGLRDGRGGVVILSGEPGVGKSRLTEEVRRRAEDGLWWMEGRCVSYGADLAYWPYIDVLRRSFGIRIEDDPVLSARALAGGLAVEGVSEVTPYFARLLGVPAPDPARDLGSVEPEAFRRGLHRAFETWMRALARTRPVVLAIEDVQWADRTSMELTTDLARLCVELPIAFYLTGRPEGVHTAAEVVPPRVAAATTRVELRTFTADDTLGMLRAMLGGDPPSPLVDAVVERTAGNPFFIREMVRALVETGQLIRIDGVWRIDDAWDAAVVPATVEGVVAARVDLLPRPAAEVLQVASVIGRVVDMDLLRLVAENVPDLPGAVDRLIASGFLDHRVIEGHDVLTFHHALVLDVAYARLLRRQRRDLHRRVAEAAEVIYGSGDDVIDLLAREYYLADAGAKAVEYLQRAGTRAKSLFANEEAILHFSRGVEVARKTPRVASRLPDLLLDLADVEDLTGAYEASFEAYDEIRRVRSEPRAWRGLATSLRKRGDFAEALAVIDEAFAVPELANADLTPLWLERAWVMVAAGRFVEAMEAAQAGLAAAPDPHDPFVGQLLLQLTRAEEALGNYGDALAHARQAQAVFDALRDVRLGGTALRYIGAVLTALGQLDEAADALRRGLEAAERTGFVEEVGGCLVNLARVAYTRGDVEEAIRCDLLALDAFERVGHVHGEAVVYANVAEKLRDSGDLDAAVHYCEKALEVGAVIGSALVLADANRTLATVRLRQDFPAEAAIRAEAAATLFLDSGDRLNGRDALTIAADAYERAGDRDRAAGALARADASVES